MQEARLQLHPAELGPIAVQIVLDGVQARVDFRAEVAATRQAIEAGLPELASALREAGLTLAGGGVFQQARDAQHGAPQGGTNHAGGSRGHGGRSARGRPADARRRAAAHRRRRRGPIRLSDSIERSGGAKLKRRFCRPYRGIGDPPLRIMALIATGSRRAAPPSRSSPHVPCRCPNG